jgi:regulatory protein
MKRAITLLAAKPRSVAELRERLLEKLWTDETIVDTVIERLREYRYLDDDQFAGDLAASRLRQRPQGRRRLEQTLLEKKLDKEAVTRALDSAFEKLPENQLIRTAIEKRVRIKGVPRTHDEKRKLYDYLLRRGFSYSAIREGISSIGNVDIDSEE